MTELVIHEVEWLESLICSPRPANSRCNRHIFIWPEHRSGRFRTLDFGQSKSADLSFSGIHWK